MGEATAGSIESSFRRSLELANEKGCTSVAVPAIGAGIGGFSTQQCAVLLLEQAQRHLNGETKLTEIRFVLYGEPTFRIFEMTHDSAKIAAQMAKLRAR
jgi:O-acetyl-ADP-ribose deacetylase (regulator of RNase III)